MTAAELRELAAKCPMNALRCRLVKLETVPLCDPPIYYCQTPDCPKAIRTLADKMEAPDGNRE